jgi:hypothetical protein
MLVCGSAMMAWIQARARGDQEKRPARRRGEERLDTRLDALHGFLPGGTQTTGPSANSDLRPLSDADEATTDEHNLFALAGCALPPKPCFPRSARRPLRARGHRSQQLVRAAHSRIERMDVVQRRREGDRVEGAAVEVGPVGLPRGHAAGAGFGDAVASESNASTSQPS